MRLLFIFTVLGVLSAAPAQVINSWIKPGSGDWQDQTAWSLGVRPAQNQTIMLTNQGWKAIAIGSATAANFPNSMTVSNLTIRGAWDTENVLLLNYVGTAVPLTVLNGLTLQDMAQIVNFNSGLVVQSGTITITNAQIFQDGGFIRTTNTTMYLQNAEYDLTNGVFEGGTVVLGLPVSARFNQYAGAVTIASLVFGEGPGGAGGHYALYGGYLSLPGGLSLVGGGGAYSSYFQSGGTNQTTRVYLEPNMYGSSPSFTLNGGLLADTSVSVVADDYGSLTLNQNGGTHIITNTLSISGGFTHGETIRPGTYLLTGGTLSAGAIDLNGYPGDALFVQSNGTASARTIYAHSAGYFASCNTHITLAGGTLSCSNLTTDDGHGTLDQSGGSLLVSNLLDLRGFRDVGAGFTYYFRYTFTGGTLTASNISISGDWIIGDSTGANRITNSGTCTLSHTIQIRNAVEQLGRFILAGTNATIDLAGSASRLSFASSIGETWASGATLVVSNWNGNPSGGGAEQLKFGTSASGLNGGQLPQIRFLNPAGFPAGNYPSKLLSTGELVPDAGTPVGGDTVNNWTNPASGRWDSAANWSLATLPASNQTVNITNAGYKAVNIDNATVTSFPNSLTVSNLSVSAPTNALSTLLLNYAGLSTPLRVLNGCVIGGNGTIDNFSSSFEVDGNAGGQLLVDGGNFTQVGGQTVVNAPVFVRNGGSMNATNGNLTLGNVTLGATNSAGSFTQDGGSIAVQQLDTQNGGYTLVSGILYAVEGTLGGLLQWGGTNYGDITINSGGYTINGGMARGNVLTIRGTFYQGDGLVDMQSVDWTSDINNNGNVLSLGTFRSKVINIHANALVFMGDFNILPGNVETESLSISNSAHVEVGGYNLFVTNNLDIGGDSAGSSTYLTLISSLVRVDTFTVRDFSHVEQYGPTGRTEVATGLNLLGGEYSFGGGTLEGPYVGVGANATFSHRGGTNLVHGSLSITGTYDASWGTLVTDGIYLRGSLLFEIPPEGSHSLVISFTNNGLMDLGGRIGIGTTNASGGQVRLSANAIIDFIGAPAQLRFSPSSAIAWTPGAHLVISNWNNSGSVHVFFGNNASGLSASQLAQIQFFNPGGFPPGNYPAQLLSTGELVPVAQPTLQSARYGSALVLTWPSGYQLLSATNVTGPYAPVSGATSPWTNSLTKPKEFFRLQGP